VRAGRGEGGQDRFAWQHRAGVVGGRGRFAQPRCAGCWQRASHVSLHSRESARSRPLTKLTLWTCVCLHVSLQARRAPQCWPSGTRLWSPFLAAGSAATRRCTPRWRCSSWRRRSTWRSRAAAARSQRSPRVSLTAVSVIVLHGRDVQYMSCMFYMYHSAAAHAAVPVWTCSTCRTCAVVQGQQDGWALRAVPSNSFVPGLLPAVRLWGCVGAAAPCSSLWVFH
jgi:hypothetical protein